MRRGHVWSIAWESGNTRLGGKGLEYLCPFCSQYLSWGKSQKVCFRFPKWNRDIGVFISLQQFRFIRDILEPES